MREEKKKKSSARGSSIAECGEKGGFMHVSQMQEAFFFFQSIDSVHREWLRCVNVRACAARTLTLGEGGVAQHIEWAITCCKVTVAPRAMTASLSLHVSFFTFWCILLYYIVTLVCQTLASLLSVTCVLLCLLSFLCPLLAKQQQGLNSLCVLLLVSCPHSQQCKKTMQHSRIVVFLGKG